MVHTVPAVCALALMFINDTVLIKRHSLFMLIVGILYGINNYFAVKRNGGVPLYWFLPWTDYWSHFYIMLIAIIFAILFLATAVLDERLTGRRSQKIVGVIKSFTK